MFTLVLGKGETEIFLSAGTRDLGFFLQLPWAWKLQKTTQVHVLATGGHSCCCLHCWRLCRVRVLASWLRMSLLWCLCATAPITCAAASARPRPRRHRICADAHLRARGRDRIRCRAIRRCHRLSGKRTVVPLRMPVRICKFSFYFGLRQTPWKLYPRSWKLYPR